MAKYNELSMEVDYIPRVGSDEPEFGITPVIDGISLLQLVTEYERAHECSPVGAYGSLLVNRMQLGLEHFLGVEADQWPRKGHAWLLACSCGDAACWPLTTKVTVTSDTVRWSNFSQDHRKDWDYRGFGPFNFALPAYQTEIFAAVHRVRADRPLS